QPVRVERSERVLGRQAAPGEAQIVVGAPSDRVVALPRIEGAFEHAYRLDQLGDDEVRIGVAVAMEVAALVDGDAADRELEVLPLARVQGPEKDLLRVPLAALVGEQEAGREREYLFCSLARDLGELTGPHGEIRDGDVGALGVPDDGDLLGACRDGRRSLG